jgi:hypothetical protein
VSLLDLNRLTEDAAQDSSIWIRVKEWPQEITQSYALSDDELEALQNGDVGLLREFGVDEQHLVKVPELAAY